MPAHAIAASDAPTRRESIQARPPAERWAVRGRQQPGNGRSPGGGGVRAWRAARFRCTSGALPGTDLLAAALPSPPAGSGGHSSPEQRPATDVVALERDREESRRAVAFCSTGVDTTDRFRNRRTSRPSMPAARPAGSPRQKSFGAKTARPRLPLRPGCAGLTDIDRNATRGPGSPGARVRRWRRPASPPPGMGDLPSIARGGTRAPRWPDADGRGADRRVHAPTNQAREFSPEFF